MRSRADVAVVLPVKAFAAAKQRLRTVLNDDERSWLAWYLASCVSDAVTATAPAARLIVACDDADVRTWADNLGAEVAWTPNLGLNGAINTGVSQAIRGGSSMILVAHADLARPYRLLDVAVSRTVTLVPDRHRDGTNVVAFPATDPLYADYGPMSFSRHLQQAMRVAEDASLSVKVFPDPDLGFDVDTVADLCHPVISKELPRWLPTHPDNRSTIDG